jgi:hypothetical protein
MEAGAHRGISDRVKRTALAAVLAIGLLAGAVFWYRAHERSRFFEPRLLLSRFPASDSIVISIDAALLRRAGVLGASKMASEPDYQQFVAGTGFDYTRDLDSVVASLSASGNYFIARGRFDWPKLRDYAAHQGGTCYQDLCRVQGSTPERHISFLPLRDDAIAIAVSPSDMAATRLSKTADPITTPLPSAPAWISIPGAALRAPDALPPALRMTFSGLQRADRVLVTFGASANGGITGANLEAHMEADCRTNENAGVLLSQLRNSTAILKDAMGRDPRMKTDDLAVTLASGTFDETGPKVNGKWPLGKGLIDALTAGI